jgi:O-antigen ligase
VVLAAGLLVIPVLYSRGLDVYSLPKELAFRAEAIALLAAGVFWATSLRRTWTLRPRRELVLVGVIVAWAAITTATSSNRLLSVDSLLTIAAAAVIFIATMFAAQTTSIVAVDVLMFGACANAAVVILQELGIWSPFVYDAFVSGHYESVGFLGNANYVGTFLAAPALAAVILAVTARGARRWIYAAIAVLLLTGLAASATRTAVAALLAGLVIFALRHSRRAALVTVVAIALVAPLALSSRTVLGVRVHEAIDAAATRDYQRLFSERMLPALAAIDMIRDHPLTGMGPGCFRYFFMDYRLRLGEHYPKEWTRGFPGYWSAAHNDHLQVAAETGLPGYALFLATIGVFVWRRAPAATTIEAAFARAMRWPLAVLLLVLCIGQFPLELAAPRLMLITLGALCITWDEGHAA